MKRILLTCLLVVVSSTALADEEPKVTELTIHAQAIESPLLKYRLLPAEIDIKSGNAVPILLRMPWEKTYYINSDAYKTLAEWQSRPLDSPEWKKFSGALPDLLYREMKRAAHRREAIWEYPIGEEPAYFILLPDVQGLRHLVGNGLAAKARHHLTRGETDEARKTILVGLANARHIAATPFFVNQLVAGAICRQMLDQTADLVAQPNSPNLYWALSTMPESLLQLNRAANFEASMFAATFAAVKDMDRPRDTAEWSKMAVQLAEVLDSDGIILPGEQIAKGVLELAETARKELPQRLSISQERVAAMSDPEAAVRWYVHARTDFDQRAGAALCLRPVEAWPKLKLLQAESKSFRPDATAQGLDPIPVYVAVWSLSRRVQALRIVEAVRDYLASHEGKFPASLAELSAVPIPSDAMTGQPFEWHVEANVATLKAPALPADVPPSSPLAGFDSTVEFKLRTK